MSEIFFFFPAILFYVLLRVYIIKTIAIKNSLTDGDAINHLGFLAMLYKNNGKIVKKIEKYILDTNDYPNGYYKLLYYCGITTNFADKYGGYISIFFDFMTFILVISAVLLWGGNHYFLIISILFLPLFFLHIGRSVYFSPRSFGVFATNLFLLGCIGFYMTNSYIFFFIAIFGFIMLSASSQFGLQAALFYTLLFSIFISYKIFLVFMASFIVSLILTKGYTITVIKGLLRHSGFYRTYLADIHPNTLKSSYAEIFHFLKQPSLTRLKYLYFNNSLFLILSSMPINILLLSEIFNINDNYVVPFLVWYLIGISIVLLISLRFLSFLGEPERYMEYNIIPAAILLSNINPLNNLTVIAILGILTLISYRQILIRFYDLKSKFTKQEKHILELLNFTNKVENKIILAIPIRLSFLLGYHNDTSKFVSWFANIGEGFLRKDFEELIPQRYAFPGSGLKKYVLKYDIDYIVLECAARKSANRIFGYDYYSELDGFTIVFSNQMYAIYQTKVVK